MWGLYPTCFSQTGLLHGRQRWLSSWGMSPALGLLVAHSTPEAAARNPGFPGPLLPPGAGALQLPVPLRSPRTSPPPRQHTEELCAQRAAGQEGTPRHPPTLAWPAGPLHAPSQMAPSFPPTPLGTDVPRQRWILNCQNVARDGLCCPHRHRLRLTWSPHMTTEAQPPSHGPGSDAAPGVASVQQQFFLV